MYLNDMPKVTLLNAMAPAFRPSIEAAVKELLEKKHLYQNLAVAWPTLPEVLKQFSNRQGPMERYEAAFEFSPKVQWMLYEPNTNLSAQRDPVVAAHQVLFDAHLPTIKIYCDNCGDVEAHNPMGAADILSEFHQYELERHLQLFLMSYRCQGCKGVPIVYLMKRDLLKLSISGRSPIETVIVPSCFPKDYRNYISDAIVAFQSGQVLAANFLLRTFIEQYVRGQSSDPHTTDIDLPFREYQASLNKTVRDEMPSLKAIYDRLSIDIHSAAGSIMVFEQAQSDLESHFEGKQLFAKLKGSN